MIKNFGHWTVLQKQGEKYLCACSCGMSKLVDGYSLRTGKSKSCGCQRANYVSKSLTRHGFSTSKNKKERLFFYTWTRMRERCTSKTAADYAYYGGRGIRVHSRWEKFDNFKEDMWDSYLSFGENPTLERRDVNGNYEKKNCEWASRLEQANNKRNNRLLTFNGLTKTLTQWAREMSMPRGRLKDRILSGWSVEKALTTVKT